ncbi:MAG: 3'-5' exonuclease, partial [Candidatus Izemoplasmatales bacterium]
MSEDPLLPQILKLLDDFNSLYPNKKYMNDLVEFMKESKMVDLYGAHSDIVTISTIHKSKGREFDTVFILQQDKEYNQADIRALYVGLTRAEKNIIIHTNSNLYDNIYETIDDENIYSEPNYLMIQMDLRDVNLRRCKYWEHVLENVSSGTELDIADDGLSYEGKEALSFSKKMKEVICKKEN